MHMPFSDMDGVSFVNQCPIVPGNSFLYDFVVPNQSGSEHSLLCNRRFSLNVIQLTGTTRTT